jgi:multidrug efflux system membrane fusion protein
MLARAILPVGKRKDSLLISKDAIVLGGRAPIVFAIDRDAANRSQGTVRIVPVELGAAVGGEIEVSGLSPELPLKPNDLIVIEGNERLRPGQPVTFAEPSASPPGSRAARD